MNKPGETLDVKAKLFRGLADMSRLSILEALRTGPKNVSQIVGLTGLSQPLASFHLDCLWCCGLVNREIAGKFRYYRIDSKKVIRLLETARAVLDDVSDRIAECERYDVRRRRP